VQAAVGLTLWVGVHGGVWRLRGREGAGGGGRCSYGCLGGAAALLCWCSHNGHVRVCMRIMPGQGEDAQRRVPAVVSSSSRGVGQAGPTAAQLPPPGRGPLMPWPAPIAVAAWLDVHTCNHCKLPPWCSREVVRWLAERLRCAAMVVYEQVSSLPIRRSPPTPSLPPYPYPHPHPPHYAAHPGQPACAHPHVAQIGPHDAFGQQMLINLESRGCALLGIEGVCWGGGGAPHSC
jgi:hypothetical protein